MSGKNAKRFQAVRTPPGDWIVVMLPDGEGIASCYGELAEERTREIARALNMRAHSERMGIVLGDLLEWAANMGGWDAPVWGRAREIYAETGE